MKDNFTHLHVHTSNSLLDGFNKIDNLLNRVKELNMDAVAITDHGTLAGTYMFQQECLKNNIKPILGIEMYHTQDINMITLPIKERKDLAMAKALEAGIEIPEGISKKETEKLIEPCIYDTKGYHLILLAKNQTGWNNLIKLSSIANENGLFNGKGHCDNKLLKQYSEGLICTSACIGSIICNSIINNKYDKALKYIHELKDIFKDDFYLELQPLNDIKQLKVNLMLIQFAISENIKLIATNDTHYTYKEDWYIHDVLLCIGTNKLYDDPNRMRYNKEFWVRSYDEMVEAFAKQFDEQMVEPIQEPLDKQMYMEYIYEALSNTNHVADCISENIKLGSEHELLPKVDVPKGFTPEKWISYQCWTRLYKYLKQENLLDKRIEYETRLQHELNVINTKGFASYFLIVQDAIEWGMNNDCPFGPGRGRLQASFM